MLATISSLICNSNNEMWPTKFKSRIAPIAPIKYSRPLHSSNSISGSSTASAKYNRIYINHFIYEFISKLVSQKQRGIFTLFLTVLFSLFFHLFQINCKNWIQFHVTTISFNVATVPAYIFRLSVTPKTTVVMEATNSNVLIVSIAKIVCIPNVFLFCCALPKPEWILSCVC